MSIDKESLKKAYTDLARIRNAVSWPTGTGWRADAWKGYNARKFLQS